jgi:hypothetical protein
VAELIEEMKGLNPITAAPGEGSSIEPMVAFSVDPARGGINATPPLIPGARGVDDLLQRKEELLSPFQQGNNRARGALSFGTIDPAGSRFLNFNSGANLAPAVLPPSVTPRPGVLEFPSRKF